MKINIRKVILMILYSIAIGLSCFASAVSLLTNNDFLKYALLSVTYLLGIMLVKKRNKYPLFIDNMQVKTKN